MIEQFGGIRVNEEGLMSVYDLIQVCAEYKGEKSKYEAWKRLCNEHPEVYSKIVHFKFEGKAQKETPVASKENALYILGLLPGVTGKKYRELAAKLVISYLQNPEQLAKAAIARTEQIAPEKLDEIEVSLREAQNRVKGIEERKSFTDLCKIQGIEGFSYSQATNRVYEASLGLKARDIKQLATGNADAKPSARSYLKDHAIRLIEWIEGLSAEVAEDSGENVVELAERFAEQATRNLEDSAKKKLTDFRQKPLTPNKARKAITG